MNGNPSPSGKTHREENFPVASFLIRAKHRPVILAFYRFARAADDVADCRTLSAPEKITRLDRMEAALLGGGADDCAREAAALRPVLQQRGLSTRHARDLLTAFRLDATKQRYADWDDLMAYCGVSAMPVGRFVLDVHGEDPAIWPASDAICAALQVINHLQDCGADYRALDRVYLPMDRLAAHGANIEALGAPAASEPLRRCIIELAGRAADLLHEGQRLAGEIADWRLRLEISVIHALGLELIGVLASRDPLSEETHLGRLRAAGVAVRAMRRCVTRGFGGAARPMLSGARP